MDNPTLPEQQYPELWHYTTEAGLKGILRSGRLWATDFRCLNDTSEVQHLKPILIANVTPLIRDLYDRRCGNDESFSRKVQEHGGADACAQHDATALGDVLYRVTFSSNSKGPFVTSFCNHEEADDWTKRHGLLSQWRAYAAGGYAIVFDTKGLREYLDQEHSNYHYWNMHLSDVIYDDETEKFNCEFRELLEVAPKAFEELLTSTEDSELTSTNALHQPFVTATSRYKHRAFKEECEVRIVAILLGEDELLPEDKQKKSCKKVHIREGDVPYIELFDCNSGRLPIRRIVVGPHQEQERLEAVAKKLAQGEGFSVQCSDTPFISRQCDLTRG